MRERKARWSTVWAPLRVMTLVWQLCPQPWDYTSPFSASFSFPDNHHFMDFIWYWAQFKNHSLLVESTNPVYYSFFPSSSKYPIANYKAKRYIFTTVKAAISQLIREKKKQHTTNAQKRTCKQDGLFHSHPCDHPKGQPSLTSLKLILPVSDTLGVLVPSY